jgi:hypothetical protein
MANSTISDPYDLSGDNAALHKTKIRGGRSAPYIMLRLYNQRVVYSDFSDADTSEALDLNATFTSNAFPANVIILAAWLQLYDEFAGPSHTAVTLQLGDAGDPNGLIDATNVWTGAGLGRKVGLTTEVMTQELAYVPLLQIDTTADDVADLTSGDVGVFVLLIEIPLLAVGTIND